MFKLRRNSKIKDKYNIHTISWADVWAILLGKLSLSIRKRFKKRTFIISSVLFVLLLFITCYFSSSKTTVTMPGNYIHASILAKDEVDGDPINLLSVRDFTVDNILDYLAVKYMNKGYNGYIDARIKKEEIRQPTLLLGSELYDMQMSSFLALNHYLGTPKEYAKDIIVTGITLSTDANPTLLPSDIILEVDGRKVEDTLDINKLKLDYKVREVKVLRGKNEFLFKTDFKGVEVGKVLALTNEQDYEEFYSYADLSVRGYTGRSAGAALSLSYYNSYIEDVAKGRNIAVTGTIDEYGSIGVVTGLKQKAVLALQNKVDILFVPKDIELLSNYTEALTVITREKSNMKVIGVTSLEDIILYLKTHD